MEWSVYTLAVSFEGVLSQELGRCKHQSLDKKISELDTNPHSVKMKEFYVGMMDTDCSSGIVIPIERKRKIKIQLCDDCYKGLHLIAKKKEHEE